MFGFTYRAEFVNRTDAGNVITVEFTILTPGEAAPAHDPMRESWLWRPSITALVINPSDWVIRSYIFLEGGEVE